MSDESKGLVLLVDDDPSILLTVGDQLVFGGYRVIKAESAEQCLALLEETSPDLIVLDIAMPGIGGLVFLAQISTPGQGLKYPVLVFTARAEMDEFFEGTSVDGFLAKTSSPTVFLNEVARIIRKHKGPKTPHPKPSRLRLLVAEDDDERREGLRHFFTALGYEIACVPNGREMIQHALTHRPDCVCVKYALPGLDGAAAAAMLANLPNARTVPVILYDDSGLHGSSATHGNVRMFVPSSAPDQLLSAIRSLQR